MNSTIRKTLAHGALAVAATGALVAGAPGANAAQAQDTGSSSNQAVTTVSKDLGSPIEVQGKRWYIDDWYWTYANCNEAGKTKVAASKKFTDWKCKGSGAIVRLYLWG